MFERFMLFFYFLFFRVLRRVFEDFDFVGYFFLREGDYDVCFVYFLGVKGLWKLLKEGLVEFL